VPASGIAIPPAAIHTLPNTGGAYHTAPIAK
jgi:hypothetical protein